MTNMQARRSTLVRQLAASFATQYQKKHAASLSEAERVAAKQELKRLRVSIADAFASSCAWCGLRQDRPQRDHFPPLVVNRLWTGYFEQVTVPSCSACNRQYADWEAHLDARFALGLQDRRLREVHRQELRRILSQLSQVDEEEYRAEFERLRETCDAALTHVDRQLAGFVSRMTVPPHL